MPTTNPTLLAMPIAENGTKNVIPATSSTFGAMSQNSGFPTETSLPLSAGGVAPKREDFNGAFNLISKHTFFSQKGWVYHWDSGQTYYKGCEVIDDNDGKKYRCKADIAAGGTRPSANSSWELAQQEVDLTPYAKLASPAFTGTPTAPTATAGTNTTQLATTAFVQTALSAIDLSSYAPKNSPALTGTPTAPTATAGTNTTQIATTAFVKTAITNIDLSAYAPKNSPALTGTPTAPTAASGTNTTQIATTAFVQSAVSGIDLSAYAPKASPALTGTPTAPTAAAGTNTTQIATTAFVQKATENAVPDMDYSGLVSYNAVGYTGGDDHYGGYTFTLPKNGMVISDMNYAKITGDPIIGNLGEKNGYIGYYTVANVSYIPMFLLSGTEIEFFERGKPEEQGKRVRFIPIKTSS